MTEKTPRTFSQLCSRIYLSTPLAKLRNRVLAHHGDAVFIWIPKSAGSSIQRALSAHRCLILLEADEVQRYFPQKGFVTFGHMDYARLVAEALVSARFHEASFKFTFVRDPFSRAVSLYRYFQKMHRCGINEQSTFLQFCQDLAGRVIDPIGLYNVQGWSQCQPQCRWLNHVQCDYVGRYESLQTDWQQICELLEIPVVPLPHVNKSRNSSIDDYRDLYCSETTDIVKSLYAEDFVAFGYDNSI